MATNNAVNSPLSGTSGTGNFVGNTSPSLTTPNITTGLYDSNGNPMIDFIPTVSSVNYFTTSNAAIGGNISISATGSDSNVALQLNGKGNKGVLVQGISSGSAISAGNKGEIISSQITSGSPVSYTSGNTDNITSISLTAGLWMVTGNTTITSSGGLITEYVGWISLTSTSIPDASLYTNIYPLATSLQVAFTVPTLFVNVSTTTTVYLSNYGTGTGTLTTCGLIQAIRM